MKTTPRSRGDATAALTRAARGLSLVALLFCAEASLGAPPPPPEDPPEPPEFPVCDAGHLAAFPLDNGPFFSPQMASPRPSSGNVPRNVEIVLAGFLGDLEGPQPFLAMRLRDAAGAEVPTTRSGRVVRPLAPLEPFALYALQLEPADPELCPECGVFDVWPFETGADFDTEAPRFGGEVVGHAFVLSEADRQCGFGFAPSSTHLLLLRVAGMDDVARVSVAVKAGHGAAATRAFDRVVDTDTHFFFRGGSEPLSLGEPVVVAVTVVDRAGNEGPTRVVRIRARAFDDLRRAPFEELALRQCVLPATVRPTRAEVVPTNARFVVEMPVEPVPMALVGADAVVPLQPVEQLPFGQVLERAAPLPSGASLTLTTRSCASCACEGCDHGAPVPVLVGDGPDQRPPEAPVVLELREDLAPPRGEGACLPDSTALVAVLERGADDATAPAQLRYDVDVRLEGQLPVELGRWLPAVTLDDERTAVRVDTALYGRLFAEPFELEIRAVDLAGNRSPATTVQHELAAAGCSSVDVDASRRPPVALALLLAGVALFRARRRPRRAV